MKKILFLLAPLFCLNAQVDLDYYLGDTSNYNQSIPTPESIIGHQIGELHVSHDKLSHYVQEVSKHSDRVKLVNRGKTYENRASWLLIITSESNQLRLEEIRKNHLELSNSKNRSIDLTNMPEPSSNLIKLFPEICLSRILLIFFFLSIIFFCFSFSCCLRILP